MKTVFKCRWSNLQLGVKRLNDLIELINKV
jgi:hypothetical protein